MSVGNEDVFVTVIIEIEEGDSPTEITISDFSDARCYCHVGEKSITFIMIKGVCFLLKIAHCQI